MRTVASLRPADSDVRRWRREQLVLSGFPLPLATRIAADHHYDLHHLIELVERGCPPALAVRICSPLEPSEAA